MTRGPITLFRGGTGEVAFEGEASPAPGGGSMPGPVLVARVATTENNGLTGLQTVDGYDVQEGEPVLVWQQENTAENGVYAASVGDWTLVPGFDACRLCVTDEAGQTTATTLYVRNPPPEGSGTWSPIGSFDWTSLTPPDSVQGTYRFAADRAEVGILEADAQLLIFCPEPADADVPAGALCVWFDSTDGAASLNFKAKTLDGTLVTASLPLAP